MAWSWGSRGDSFKRYLGGKADSFCGGADGAKEAPGQAGFMGEQPVHYHGAAHLV